MRSTPSLGALAATALVSGAVTATPIATPVVDVEFWGRQELSLYDPETNTDIITYGDPVQGSFRIWTEDAPSPHITSYFLDHDKAVVYGQDLPRGGGPFTASSFVTSRWLSPFPAGFTRDVAPFPGATANDQVTIGDGVRFLPHEPRKDWFMVGDAFVQPVEGHGPILEELLMQLRTPFDVVQGLGLDQEFEIADTTENGGRGNGYFTHKVDDAVHLFRFVVDRLRVSKDLVCRP